MSQAKAILLASVLSLLFLGNSVGTSSASTYYVRTDGGTLAQCTGLVDVPYSENVVDRSCAVNHIFWLLPPPNKAPLISGGDTIVIGPGQYMMGINAVGDAAPNTSACQGGTGTFSCMMSAIPSGPDASRPTTIIGKNWDTKLTAPPQLWGAGRTDHIISLVKSNNVVLRYLDITDHAQCGYNFINNPSLMCNRTVAPYGYQADYGIYATDSSNVLLKDITIHGLASGAIHAGRLTDWTLDNVTIHGNAFNGWNGDVGHGAYGSGTDSSLNGDIKIIGSKVNYNGCVESYPLNAKYPFIVAGGCYGQGQGGYGDGIGMYYTEGNWFFENSEFLHNTQDGIDLLYHTGQTGKVSVKNTRSEGNSGQQLKIGTSAQIENTVIIGDCNYYYNNPLATQAGFTHCRAAGTPIAFQGWRPNFKVSITNSTIIGPNKIFMELGSGAATANALGSGNVTGSATSIKYDNQFSVNQAQDTIWLRWSGNYDPNKGQVIVRYNNYASRVPLVGQWIYDYDGIYHLTGVGAQTGGNFTFNDIIKAYVCDGTEQLVSRNNIFAGMEWWSTSIQKTVPGTFPDLIYLNGWDGNGKGACAETFPIRFDNKDGIAYNTKVNQCPNDNNVLCVDPKLTNVPPFVGYSDIYTYGEKWNITPLAASQAVGKSSSLPGSIVSGTAIIPRNDIRGSIRPTNTITWGAYEFNAAAPSPDPITIRGRRLPGL
jgi:hypothetical protein